jgi:Protein phosphatase 2C
VIPLSRADSGEFAGQTRFLTMAEVWQDSNGINDRIDFKVTPDITAIVAMTDGVSDPKFETDAKFAEANCWHELWKELAAVGLEPGNEKAADELLDWLGFWSVGNHDDRTLAVLLPT